MHNIEKNMKNTLSFYSKHTVYNTSVSIYSETMSQ